MSKLEGGIFSRPRGKTGGIVFGAARTRRGKQVTTRLLVPPSNPRTAAQQSQRGKFRTVLDIVKSWGPDVYQDPFNRTVSQLAGFQSLMSTIMNSIDSGGYITDPSNSTLLRGSHPLPVNLDVSYSGGTYSITWDDSPGPGGNANDEVFLISVGNDSNGIDKDSAEVHTGQTIGDGATGYSVDEASSAQPEVWFALWVVGSEEGIFSNIKYGIDPST